MIMELVFGIDIVELVGKSFYILVLFILFDVITGLLRAAKDRVLNSSINFDGLIRKFGELVGVAFLTLVDFYFHTNGFIIKTGVGLLIVYEGISIIENLKKIGIEWEFLMKYFDEDKYKGGKKQ